MKNFYFSFLLGFFALSAMGSSLGTLSATELSPREPGAQGQYFISGNWLELKRGWNTLILKITDPNDQPVTEANVSVVYDMLDMPMTPPDNPVLEKGDGIYEKRIFLGMRGEWKFDTLVQKNETEDTHHKIQMIGSPR